MTRLEFTGERYVPGQGGAQIAYEHLHRYLFALRWAKEKEVLDIATGAAYGAFLLSKVARRVWALDLDAAAVTHARADHPEANLVLVRADAARLPFGAATMDLVVAFEVLEHLDDAEAMIREAARVVRVDGLALISTPNKAIYSDARQYHNPFHIREFYRDEFVELLDRYFRRVCLVHQQVRAGSLILPERREMQVQEVLTEAREEMGKPAGAMYMLAVCSKTGIEETALPDSAYLDLSDSLLQEGMSELSRTLREVEKLNQEIRQLGLWGQSREREIELRDRTILGLQEDLARETQQRDQTIAKQQADYGQLQADFDQRGRWALSLQNEVEIRDERIRQANVELDRVNAELSRVAAHLLHIRRARLYRILCRLGLLPK